MSIYDWPDNTTDAGRILRPIGMRWGQRVNSRTSTSSLTGATQTTTLPGSRWTLSVDWPAQTWDDRAVVEAFLMRLAGQQNRVRAWDFARPQPRGTIATSGVTLGAAGAQFSSTLQLANCRTDNLLLGAGFEFDSDSNGIADGWSVYATGPTGTVTAGLIDGPFAGLGSGKYQAVFASALAAGGLVGVRRIVPITAGLPYSFSIEQGAFSGTQRSLVIDWLDAGLTVISASGLYGQTADGRLAINGAIAPAGAVSAALYVLIQSSSGAVQRLNVDNAKFEQSAVATPYTGPATLLAGDPLAVGGQLLRVAADAQANDAGAMTVEVMPMLRAAQASGAAITLARASALFMLATPELTFSREPGRMAPPLSVDFVEAFS